MGDTELLYLALLALFVAERLVELALTRRNLRRLLARGGRLVTAGDPWGPMVVLHTALLIAAPMEVLLLGRPFLPALAVSALALLLGTQALRWWTISTLGDRWTARIVVVPGEGPVTGGPFRWLRHPNYLAVILEVAALPLVHTAWGTALVASLANAWVLRRRIRVEEEALEAAGGYRAAFGGRAGLVPRRSSD